MMSCSLSINSLQILYPPSLLVLWLQLLFFTHNVLSSLTKVKMIMDHFHSLHIIVGDIKQVYAFSFHLPQYKNIGLLFVYVCVSAIYFSISFRVEGLYIYLSLIIWILRLVSLGVPSYLLYLNVYPEWVQYSIKKCWGQGAVEKKRLKWQLLTHDENSEGKEEIMLSKRYDKGLMKKTSKINSKEVSMKM